MQFSPPPNPPSTVGQFNNHDYYSKRTLQTQDPKNEEGRRIDLGDLRRWPFPLPPLPPPPFIPTLHFDPTSKFKANKKMLFPRPSVGFFFGRFHLSLSRPPSSTPFTCSKPRLRPCVCLSLSCSTHTTLYVCFDHQRRLSGR